MKKSSDVSQVRNSGARKNYNSISLNNCEKYDDANDSNDRCTYQNTFVSDRSHISHEVIVKSLELKDENTRNSESTSVKHMHQNYSPENGTDLLFASRNFITSKSNPSSSIAKHSVNNVDKLLHKCSTKSSCKAFPVVRNCNSYTVYSSSKCSYKLGRVLGNGSFGTVYEAIRIQTNQRVAIKKVLQDPRYKNRELLIMMELHHPNVIELQDYFYTKSVEKTSTALEGESDSITNSQTTNKYLNVVMEYVPDTVHRVMQSYLKNNKPINFLLIKLYTYQMCRSLGYLHQLGICHRDVKPQNLLVDTETHILKLCDLGSAKKLLLGESSVAYICSRFYRAPELMLGATEYTTAIDIWSMGCVLGELLLGVPLFSGETSVDQLVKIIHVLGTPTRKQILAMNPNYTDYSFPEVAPSDWNKILGFTKATADQKLAKEILTKFLRYEPEERLSPFEALGHELFDELRDPSTRLPSGEPLPKSLFKFSDEELLNMSAETRKKVIPHCMCNHSSESGTNDNPNSSRQRHT